MLSIIWALLSHLEHGNDDSLCLIVLCLLFLWGNLFLKCPGLYSKRVCCGAATHKSSTSLPRNRQINVVTNQFHKYFLRTCFSPDAVGNIGIGFKELMVFCRLWGGAGFAYTWHKQHKGQCYWKSKRKRRFRRGSSADFCLLVSFWMIACHSLLKMKSKCQFINWNIFYLNPFYQQILSQ